MKTVQATVQQNLCTGCGVCRSICPRQCISWRLDGGMYLPEIDASSCVSCGLCAGVCPGLGHRYESKTTAEETVTGPVLECFNAWSRNPRLRHVSASGGVVSTLICQLLQKGHYSGAFCLDSYDYRSQLKTRLYTPADFEQPEETAAPKSRYLPVSHENALAYMKENRTARLILVGTPCAFRGLQAAMEKLKLNRENYLFIGLICDKIFNYNVLPYFRDTYASGREAEALHFKNKESGGWPGDMKFFPKEGDPFFIPLAERGKAKDYFSLERCMYCVDKLNLLSDISLGDNYTGRDTSSLGSNSVIIRTQRGLDAWAAAADQLEYASISVADIQKAQDLPWRLNNLCYGDLKARNNPGMDLNTGVPRNQQALDFERTWIRSLKKLRCGACYDSAPEKLRQLQQQESRKPNPLLQFIKRVYYYIRRKIR